MNSYLLCMSALKTIKSKMIYNNYTKSTFHIEFNSKVFSCIFIIDQVPYELYITTLGIDPFTFKLDVLKGFMINPILDNAIYRELIKYLELKYNPKNKFSTTAFFNHINKVLPLVTISKVSTSLVLQTVSKTKKIEEANKIYFLGWRHNNANCNVTPENLEKTQIAFDDKIAKMCYQNNISSCWTDNPNEEHNPNFNIIKI